MYLVQALVFFQIFDLQLTGMWNPEMWTQKIKSIETKRAKKIQPKKKKSLERLENK